MTDAVVARATYSSMSEFEALRDLGRGSFAVVRLVRCKADGSLMVIKQFHDPLRSLPEKQRMEVFQEVRLLSHLNHPNVIKFLGKFTEDDIMHIVMEYASAGTLHKKIAMRDGELFPEDEIWEMFVQVVSAMAYVHKCHILHRDLKGENIMLSGIEGRVIKLGDFGIAKVLGSQADQAFTVVGTPQTLSPELVQGQPYDQKSDVWALGCVLYEMVALRKPFDASNLAAILFSIMKNKPPPIPSGYSSRIHDMLGLLLNANPSKRPSLDEIERMPVVMEHMAKWRATYRRLEVREGLPPGPITRSLTGTDPMASSSTAADAATWTPSREEGGKVAGGMTIDTSAATTATADAARLAGGLKSPTNHTESRAAAAAFEKKMLAEIEAIGHDAENVGNALTSEMVFTRLDDFQRRLEAGLPVSGKVWELLGRAWADCARFDKAIQAYRRSLRAKSANASLVAMEQLGNLLVRRAQQVWSQARNGDPEGALKAAQEASAGSQSGGTALLQRVAAASNAGGKGGGGGGKPKRVSAVDMGMDGGGVGGGGGGEGVDGASGVVEEEEDEPAWRRAASALMFEGLAYIERMCALGSTAERRSLLGSAYKRRAWTGLGASRKEDLVQAAENYAAAHAIELSAGEEHPSPYARLNQLTLEMLAGSGTGEEREALLAGAKEAEEWATFRVEQDSEDVWLWVQVIDAKCLRYLLGDDEVSQADVLSKYRELFSFGASQRVKSSMFDQFSFLMEVLAGRAVEVEQEALTKAAKAGVGASVDGFGASDGSVGVAVEGAAKRLSTSTLAALPETAELMRVRTWLASTLAKVTELRSPLERQLQKTMSTAGGGGAGAATAAPPTTGAILTTSGTTPASITTTSYRVDGGTTTTQAPFPVSSMPPIIARTQAATTTSTAGTLATDATPMLASPASSAGGAGAFMSPRQAHVYGTSASPPAGGGGAGGRPGSISLRRGSGGDLMGIPPLATLPSITSASGAPGASGFVPLESKTSSRSQAGDSSAAPPPQFNPFKVGSPNPFKPKRSKAMGGGSEGPVDPGVLSPASSATVATALTTGSSSPAPSTADSAVTGLRTTSSRRSASNSRPGSGFNPFAKGTPAQHRFGARTPHTTSPHTTTTSGGDVVSPGMPVMFDAAGGRAPTTSSLTDARSTVAGAGGVGMASATRGDASSSGAVTHARGVSVFPPINGVKSSQDADAVRPTSRPHVADRSGVAASLSPVGILQDAVSLPGAIASPSTSHVPMERLKRRGDGSESVEHVSPGLRVGGGDATTSRRSSGSRASIHDSGGAGGVEGGDAHAPAASSRGEVGRGGGGGILGLTLHPDDLGSGLTSPAGSMTIKSQGSGASSRSRTGTETNSTGGTRRFPAPPALVIQNGNLSHFSPSQTMPPMRTPLDVGMTSSASGSSAPTNTSASVGASRSASLLQTAQNVLAGALRHALGGSTNASAGVGSGYAPSAGVSDSGSTPRTGEGGVVADGSDHGFVDATATCTGSAALSRRGSRDTAATLTKDSQAPPVMLTPGASMEGPGGMGGSSLASSVTGVAGSHHNVLSDHVVGAAIAATPYGPPPRGMMDDIATPTGVSAAMLPSTRSRWSPGAKNSFDSSFNPPDSGRSEMGAEHTNHSATTLGVHSALPPPRATVSGSRSDPSPLPSRAAAVATSASRRVSIDDPAHSSASHVKRGSDVVEKLFRSSGGLDGAVADPHGPPLRLTPEADGTGKEGGGGEMGAGRPVPLSSVAAGIMVGTGTGGPAYLPVRTLSKKSSAGAGGKLAGRTSIGGTGSGSASEAVGGGLDAGGVPAGAGVPASHGGGPPPSRTTPGASTTPASAGVGDKPAHQHALGHEHSTDEVVGMAATPGGGEVVVVEPRRPGNPFLRWMACCT